MRPPKGQENRGRTSENGKQGKNPGKERYKLNVNKMFDAKGMFKGAKLL